MESVLEIARLLQVPLCILRFPNPNRDVYGGKLSVQVNQFTAPYRISHNKHSLFHDVNFRGTFLTAAISAVVVMGFDADICVRANVFGCPELNEDGYDVGSAPAPAADPTLVRALVNEKDVITSRPMLLTGGTNPIQGGLIEAVS